MPNPFEIYSGLGRRVRRGKNLGFDEAYLDLQSQDHEVLDDEKDAVNYRMLGGIVVAVLLVLGFRLFFLQAVQGADYRSLAEGNKLRVQYVLAPRGLLLDRNGEIIASNTPSFELDVVTGDLTASGEELDLMLQKIGEVLGLDPAPMRETIATMRPKSFQVQPLVENITKDQALILIARAQEFPGFVVEDVAIRDYKDPIMFSHLVGYTGKITESEIAQAQEQGVEYALNDYIGKTGLEVQYEEFLRGVDGKKQTEIDAAGNFKRQLAELPATPGSNVVLNIDYGLQQALYEQMVPVMERAGSPKAAAIATNPQTGEVLAFISLPGFDNNMFARGITSEEYAQLINDPNFPLLNRVIAGTYPPGSTVKPVMALAALSEEIVTPQTRILDDGVIRIGSYTYYGYERSGLGIMDVYSAIARSSDIYFYTVGGGNPKTEITEGLGPDRIADYLRKFWTGRTLGIDLPNEKPGLVPDTQWKEEVRGEPWFLGNTYHYSIGQGDLLTTPLQVHNWTATIANDGRMMKPYILRQAVSQSGEVLAEGKSEVLAENQFDPEYLQIVQNAMRQTVTDGSARSMAALPVTIAGKTGTAQFISRNLTDTHAWFTSYAPFENPQIALTVLVEAGGEGHAVAGAIARETYRWWAENRYNK